MEKQPQEQTSEQTSGQTSGQTWERPSERAWARPRERPSERGAASAGAAPRPPHTSSPHTSYPHASSRHNALSPYVPAQHVPSERGATTIADRVVRKIAEQAAREVMDRDEAPRHVSVTRRGDRASLSLDVRLGYPSPLADRTERLRSHVASTTARLTGLSVPRTDLQVTSLAPPARERAGAAPQPAGSGDGTSPRAGGGGGSRGRVTGRPWSARRAPAAAVALVGAAVCGAVLYDVVAVDLGKDAAAARTALWEWLLDARVTDGRVVTAALVLLAIGLWMLAAAVLPGLRGRLPLTRDPRAPRVRAVLDRPAAALLLRDAALELPGVTAARVAVGRRRARVRLAASYGELTGVRGAAYEGLGTALAGFALARPVRMRVKVSRDKDWLAPGAVGTGTGAGAGPGGLAGPGGPATSDGPAAPDGSAGRPEEAGRVEEPEPSGSPGGTDRPVAAKKPERPERPERPGGTDEPGTAKEPEPAGPPEPPGSPERPALPESVGPTDEPRRPEGTTEERSTP
ncbi:DUF6286 domain-containing Asp23/Gls24 family envelope stress response protein [Streptomyces tsukubensis]|uniref:DUF6286 domain-containing Asp23/Gls24 family envelope stress response protein n=1 Tax=Streptomyces tsukubensis TaxID=83656 RepID=UPI0009900B99|nr:DUF6286 domain-containing Asp23/Gls24 family envelope stress response protein [Streptomyces tsukubensis]QFR95129.1 hypothetical protein GBW32_21525 [Streptomyces tsukubensis]